MKYRELSAQEIDNYFTIAKANQNLDTYRKLIAFVKEHYGQHSKSIHLLFGNEYNDAGYDTCLNDILVFDENGLEIKEFKSPLTKIQDDYEDKRHDLFRDYVESDVGMKSTKDNLIIYTETQILPKLYIETHE